MKHILILAGTRPEAIKVAPVVRLLRQIPAVRTTLVASGQHREMLQQAFEDLDIEPDRDLAVMRPGQSLSGLTSRLFETLGALFEGEKPDWVLGQGDTTTVFVASVCAFYLGIPFGHIEAGLRSHRLDAPFPEEFNRRVTGVIAQKHFAPTGQARENLLREHIPDASILVTGNTVIDSLQWMRDSGEAHAGLLAPDLQRHLAAGKRLLLVTGHRRENHGQGFEDICQALLSLVERFEDMVVTYPVHPNPKVHDIVQERLGGHSRILLVQPAPYKPFVALMNAAHVVLTDSGGVQEEAPALGKPVLVLRDVTERPEGIAAGTARLVGTDPGRIVDEVVRLWTDQAAYAAMAHAVSPYGDGRAAGRIVKGLLPEMCL